MKSSFELAMERLGGIKELPPEKKKRIAEIDSKFKSKIAEAELSAERKIKNSGDLNEIEEIKRALSAEIASFKEKSEREKEKIRTEN